MKRIIVAIDGPASSGKSTTAKLLAKKLGYVYLDTGAMYRACALYAERKMVPLSDPEGIVRLMEEIDIQIRFAPEGNIVLLGGEDVSLAIRRDDISKKASDISALGVVREKMVDLQRRIGQSGGVVLDGRDIGTVVFPEAEVKFFMVADVNIRARRRWQEMIDKGQQPVYEEVLKELAKRDKNDSSRDLAPLKPADDAIEIDNTRLTIDEQVEKLYQIVLQRLQSL
ncbi:MAG: (d)CMP kinase [Candidatus Cloacimonadaceae bacterium]|nr:(d)CMP kinase [Candidatus Cloacimonadaceae bacterium]